MVTFPNAKINLGLNIVRKRDDGYHDIESCFYPISWNDSLEIIEADSFGFYSYGLEIPGDAESNLCVKAYGLLKKDFDIPPVAIHLLKGIPMGAGLGGGSADAAFTLKVLNDLFGLALSTEQLATYALKLGSDCPFFIKNIPAIASGRGEVLTEVQLNLAGYFLGLINPDIHISTKEAYSGIQPKRPEVTISDIISTPIETWSGLLANDFEQSIFSNHPKIAQVKQDMYDAGAIYASMTGSGSTVYGIFKEKIELSEAKMIRL